MPTFGYESVGASFKSVSTNAVGSSFTLTISNPVHITKITARVYDNFGNAAPSGMAGIYDSGGNLLGKSNSIRYETGNFFEAWLDFPFDAPVKINSSGDYTLVIWLAQTSLNIRYDAGSTDQGKHATVGTYSSQSSLPPSLSFTLLTDRCSIYATYSTELITPFQIEKKQASGASGISVSVR